jgi:lambda repressor-like predicted transcriptional regulator
VTPRDLRRQADEIHALAEAARDRGDAREVFVLLGQVELLRELAREMEARGVNALPTAVNKPIMDSNVFTAEHKVEMSRAKVDPRNKLAAAAHGAGLSMADLARKAGVSPSLLNKASKGLRALPRAAAETIERLTGYPVDGGWKRLS